MQMVTVNMRAKRKRVVPGEEALGAKREILIDEQEGRQGRTLCAGGFQRTLPTP